MPPGKPNRYPMLLVVAILAVAAMAGFSIARVRLLAAPGKIQNALAWNPNPQNQTHENLPQDENLTQDKNLTQDDEDSDTPEVPPAQVEEYVKVYQSMQRNRSLTVDQATAAQHMTVDQFRDIETRIEKDGVLRERVRRELLKTAQEKSNALKLKPQSAPSPAQP
jgi:hypothetical protein